MKVNLMNDLLFYFNGIYKLICLWLGYKYIEFFYPVTNQFLKEKQQTTLIKMIVCIKIYISI